MTPNLSSKNLIEISNSEIDVSNIVNQIDQKVKQKKIEYLQELNQNLPSIINVCENSEYLLDGWYDNEIINSQRVKWTNKEFSFLFNSNDQNQITFKIALFPPNISKHPLQFKLYINNSYISTRNISKEKNNTLSFKIPDKYANQNITVQIKLSYTFNPAQLSHGGDNRELGVAISQISNTKLTELGSKYLQEISNINIDLSIKSEKIRLHSNPESFLPKNTNLKFFKKLILKTINVFTAIQVVFNNFVADFTKNILAQQKVIVDYLTGVDSKVSSLQDQIEKKPQYEPTYWTDLKDSYYQFHQNTFRGNPKDILTSLEVYLKYLKKPVYYKKNPFIDIGCGRGEFLQLLKNQKINSFGIDINDNFVDELRQKNINVIQSDAIAYLQSTKNKFGGISAFHLVEHFAFPQLFDFLCLVKDHLTPKGIVILETPNPDNILVAANYFYNDFSHITKLPPLLLTKTMEFIGFKDICILDLHPNKTDYKKSEVDKLLRGPMDYAVIATV